MLLLTLLNFTVAIAGASLAIYLLFAARGYILRLQVAAIAAAVTIWAIWPLIFRYPAIGAAQSAFFPDLVLLLSGFALVERLLRGPYRQSLPLTVRNSLRWIWLLVLCLVLAALTEQPWLLRVLSLADALLLAMLTLSLLGLALAGQCYGDAIIEPHGRLRNLCSAVALLFAGMVFPHAIDLLSVATPAWPQIVRSVGLLLALYLFASSAQGSPQWSLAVYISPQARAYAPRILSAAVALFLLLVLAPLFRAAPDLQPVLAPAVITCIMGVLLVVLFSERIRAQLGVYGSKRFLPFRYDYRGEWLRLTDTLASPGQQRSLPERSIQALAQIVDSSAGALWLVDQESGSYACVEVSNMAKPTDFSVPLNDPAIEFMRSRNWILDTVEWQRRPELYAGLDQPDWLNQLPEAILIVPLLSGEEAIGFVVLLQPSSKFRLTFEEIDLLRTSGRQVAAHLAQYQADRQLAEAKQFEAFNRLTAFVMHDLKNLIAQQSLMVRNASRHKDNPEFFKDSMATIENSVARMQKLLQQLQSGESAGPTRDVDLRICIDEAIQKCSSQLPVPVVTEAEQGISVHIDVERFTSVLAHLLRNAQDATDKAGLVTVSMSSMPGWVRILITDDGCGMEDEFVRSRLFRPFDSTKGSQGMGIGAYQARSFIVASGGTMIVRSAPGQGTTIDIQLPAVARSEGRSAPVPA